MKKLFLAVMVTAVLCVCLSCDKSSNLLIGKWNWVNPYPSNYAASHRKMTLEFTMNNFDIKFYYEDPTTHERDDGYAKGTYEYNKSAGTLTLYPTEGDYWGDNTRKAKYYTVQTLNENKLVLVYILTGSIHEFTR